MIVRDLLDLLELQTILCNYVLAKRGIVVEGEPVCVNLMATILCARPDETMGDLSQVRVELTTGDDIPSDVSE